MSGNGKEYLYYPGCTVKATGRACEESFLTVGGLLGMRITELKDWNCCGATSYMCIDEIAAFILAARNLSLVREAGHTELVTPCSACYLILTKTQDYIGRYPQIREKVEKALKVAGLAMPAPVKIRHPLEVLHTDFGPEGIKSKVVRRWEGGPIACYYGCQIVRPYSSPDQAYNPMQMEGLMGAIGAPTVLYPLKTRCCGGSLTGTIHDVGVRLSYILQKEALRRGAQAIVTTCALCQFNLDAYQQEIRKGAQAQVDMPILYLTQVIGWALGADFRSLGFHRALSGKDLIKQWFSAKIKEESYV